MRLQPAARHPKQTITLRLDSDVIDWLRRHRNYNAALNDWLLRRMQAPQKNETSGFRGRCPQCGYSKGAERKAHAEKRIGEIAAMRCSGMKLREIAGAYGVSIARIQYLLKRQGCEP